MQILTRLEAHRTARCNRNLGSSARVSPNPGLAWPHVEYSETAQLNPLSLGQCMLQALKDRIHGMLGLVARQAGTFNHMMNNVLLDQCSTSRVLISA